MTRRGVFVWLLCATLASIAALSAFAKPGVVRTTDGHSYEGDVDEKEDFVNVNTHGIITRIERSRIAGIDYGGSFEEVYKQKLAKLDPKDARGRIELARQAFDNRQYILARDTLDEALKIDPNNIDALALLDTVQSQMRLERTKQADGAHRPASMPEGRPETKPATTQAGEHKLLTAAEINLIRQAELRSTDVGVRLRFDRDVRKRYANLRGIAIADFLGQPQLQQALEILDKGPPDMKMDIAVLNDPPSIFQYRRLVQPFVLRNCATSNCHGKEGTPGFWMINPGDTEAAAYTNFFILQQYSKNVSDQSGPFGRGVLKVIDRSRGPDSLMLQYALPQTIAEYKHPQVMGYKQSLTGLGDPRYTQLLSWVRDVLAPVVPNYGIEFAGYGISATSQPTSQPSTQSTTQPATKPSTRPTRPRPVTQPRPPAPPAATRR